MMARKRTYRSDVLRSAHLIAQDLHAVGAIGKATMREFDRACLTEIDEFGSAAIKRIRNNGMSQRVRADLKRGTVVGERMGARRGEAERTLAQAAQPRR
jgi:hypothetical protein